MQHLKKSKLIGEKKTHVEQRKIRKDKQKIALRETKNGTYTSPNWQ